MVSLVAIIVWRVPSPVVLIFFLFFALLDGAYISSALIKVPQGAWFTIVLAFILSAIFILWRWGKEQQWTAEAEDRITAGQLLQRPTYDENSQSPVPSPLMLTAEFGGGQVSTAGGLGIFFDKVGTSNSTVPKVFTQFLRKFKSRPEVVLFFHMRPLSVPTVEPEERFVITRATPYIPSCYRVTLRHGYTDDVLTPDLGGIIVQELQQFISHGSTEASEAAVRDEIEALDRAKNAQTIYIMGKQVMHIRRDRGNLIKRMLRIVFLEAFLWIRENSRTKLADLDIDHDNLVEVGFVKDV
jgi:KUP system potassium uptake protein